MISRTVLSCLQQPLLHTVWPAAAAATATASAPLWATAATAQLLPSSNAATAQTCSASPSGSWRCFSAEAPSSSLPADAVPWSSGIASSSQRQVCADGFWVTMLVPWFSLSPQLPLRVTRGQATSSWCTTPCHWPRSVGCQRPSVTAGCAMSALHVCGVCAAAGRSRAVGAAARDVCWQLQVTLQVTTVQQR